MSEAMAVAVHGGAGREAPEERKARRTGVARAAAIGWEALAGGGTALQAVVAAVVDLEDDPAFNAGRGSVLTEEGGIELDASLMEGDGLRAGAVAAVSGVANPILAARAVMEEARVVLLFGEPVRVLAERHGLRIVEPAALMVESAVRRWRERRGGAPGETVGAIARDAHGHVAAATSTGGVAGKRAGRVGDSAVIGAGTYADDLVGAGSATGPGEAIIRIGLVRVALEAIARGADPTAAAREALAVLSRRLGQSAGVILVDARGRIGVCFTTPAMPAAWRGSADGAVVVGG